MVKTLSNPYKLRKHTLYQEKYVHGKKIIKKRTLYSPIDRQFHAELLRRAEQFFWLRAEGSIGSVKRVNPLKFMSNLSGADLMIQCDIQDCFPSITVEMAEKAIKKYTNLNKNREGMLLKQQLLRAAFVQTPIGSFLAQGVPVSPLICNCVCTEIDLKMKKMLENEKIFIMTHYNGLRGFNNKTDRLDSEFLTKYTETGPLFKYARYVDNIAVAFWNFPDSFWHWREAKKESSQIADGVIKIAMAARERIWAKTKKIIQSASFTINKNKTKYRRRHGSRPIHYVGVTLNARPRANKRYIENLRCKIHNFASYLEDCKNKKAFLVKNPKFLERLRGECLWVLGADPFHRRISKCLKKAIRLEKEVLNTRHLGSLERYLG